jgi:hypothetical protein
MQELRDVLDRPGMLPRGHLKRFVDKILENSTIVDIHGLPMGVRDPKDEGRRDRDER